ncbi:DUF5684 domain-containing protein [Psychromicrobium xiongbiense]|uniref:DUF5684 domain-containing protein n=1 Tax=Psychromicrobium xiongbiense TaxID=3051184 RepID=UPI0025564B10|nr:DUF5684 domain-containing protein [Psychromicrobium sp. YIM S02556]
MPFRDALSSLLLSGGMLGLPAVTSKPPVDAGMLGLIILLYFIFVLFIYLMSGVIWMGVFRKAGYPAWVGFVPLYNTWVIVKIGGRPESNFWLMFIPYAGLYWMVLSVNSMVKSFGKESSYTAGVILLPWIFVSMLSFGKAQYLGPSYVDPYPGYPGANGQQPMAQLQSYPQQAPQPGGYAQSDAQPAPPQGYYAPATPQSAEPQATAPQPPAAPQPFGQQAQQAQQPYGQQTQGPYGWQQPYEQQPNNQQLGGHGY